jgi:DNA-binding winged helix-turn-helix (wHTH) protein/TolB-like protein/Flp pilus assembly protein TadD
LEVVKAVMSEEKLQIYEFGPFRLDAARHLLFRNGEVVPLTPKVFDTLRVLIERSGRQVTKDQLMNEVWEGSIVEETNLTTNISHLRKALGEKKNEHQYILTIPGGGYRFVAAVKAIPADGTDVIIRERTRESLIIEEETAITARHSSSRVRLILAAALVLLVVVVGFFIIRKQSPPPSTSNGVLRIKSIAVLPFKPLAAGNRDESLELGMTETLVTRLNGLKEIAVRPISAVRKYSGLEQDAVAAGRELQVEAILDGSVQKAGNRVRVTVRFVRVTDSQTLWTESFDEDFTELLAVQDRVSARVVSLLAVKLSAPEQRLLTKRYTENTTAYESYLKGRFFFTKFTPADHRRAIEYFNQAIENDSGYALAYSGLADTYAASATSSWINPAEGYIKAKAATMKALQLDDNLAEAHTSLGAVSMFCDYDWATAEREYKRALELNPNYQIAYELYGYLLNATSRFAEGIEMTKRGLKIDPLSVLLIGDMGMAYYLARNYDEALKQYQTSIRLDANDAWGHLYSAMAYHQKGMHKEAAAACQKAISVSERNSQNLAVLGYIYAASGNRSEALKLLVELTQMSGQKHVSPYDLAILYTGLGEKDKAIAQLIKAYEEPSGWFINLNVDPMLDPLRADSRFVDLVRRVNLPPNQSQ